MPDASTRIVAATDGSCNPNPGPCAWAYVLADERGRPARTASGGLGHGTNQVAELAAVLAVLDDTSGPITVYADSRYAINCLTTWLPAWRRNGWLNSSRRPVANRHLIERAAARMEGRDVRLEWVRGHNGHPLNEAADQAANAALSLPDQRGYRAPHGEGGPPSPNWRPEHGRSARCADCGGLVQQYPVDDRWVVLDAGPSPALLVPPAHRWRVDEEGRAGNTPAPHPANEGEEVRTRHVDVCAGRPGGLPDWAVSLRTQRRTPLDAERP
jgi:ribonuclease HI